MYLKSLHELAVGDEPVPISALAERLGHNVVSSTEMIHRLEGRGLVAHHPYHGVQLTPAGAEHARALVRRHRLWERFLFDMLGLEWGAVHTLACELEHAVGDEVTEALDQRLGRPTRCPHGNPIPGASADPLEPSESLAEVEPGEPTEVMAVHPETENVLGYLARHDLQPGSAVTVESFDPASRSAVIRTSTAWVPLPPDVTSCLRVRRIEAR
jgi:DtxR family transcriptional regulator, Mn-dependent transcriptional regulator